ncbi:MAG: hypothetical protein Q4A64_03295 [Porphyromonadaceae bacterium]|nr:hypothetical protein [Porphyromonadaceae bacterium]
MSRRVHKQHSLLERDEERLSKRPPLCEAERIIFGSPQRIALELHRSRRISYHRPMNAKRIAETIKQWKNKL